MACTNKFSVEIHHISYTFTISNFNQNNSIKEHKNVMLTLTSISSKILCLKFTH